MAMLYLQCGTDIVRFPCPKRGPFSEKTTAPLSEMSPVHHPLGSWLCPLGDSLLTSVPLVTSEGGLILPWGNMQLRSGCACAAGTSRAGLNLSSHVLIESQATLLYYDNPHAHSFRPVPLHPPRYMSRESQPYFLFSEILGTVNKPCFPQLGWIFT